MELIIVFVIICIVFVVYLIKRKRQRLLEVAPIPDDLGFNIEQGKKISEKLQQSFPPSFEKRLKDRVLTEHPNIDENEFNWRFFELKRYFVMNGLLKSVPMFSNDVDLVWHEMLMFTKEYESFTKTFYGEFLHHIPNTEITPIPDERAFFDWIYLSLFKPYKNSVLLWNGFLKNPLHKTLLEDFSVKSEDELRAHYFKNTEESKELELYFIRKLKSEIKRADEKLTSEKANSEEQLHLLLPAMVFFSLYNQEDYTTKMSTLLPYPIAGSSNGTACSGYACSSSKDNSSSCSSDSASCGSGCSS